MTTNRETRETKEVADLQLGSGFHVIHGPSHIASQTYEVLYFHLQGRSLGGTHPVSFSVALRANDLTEDKALFRQLLQAYERKIPVELNWDSITEAGGQTLQELAQLLGGDRAEAGVSLLRKGLRFFSGQRRGAEPVDETESLIEWLRKLSSKVSTTLLIEDVDQLEIKYDRLSWRILECVAREPKQFPHLRVLAIVRNDTHDGRTFLERITHFPEVRRVPAPASLTQSRSATVIPRDWTIAEYRIIYVVTELLSVGVDVADANDIRDIFGASLDVDTVLGQLISYFEPTDGRTLKLRDPELGRAVRERLMSEPQYTFAIKNLSEQASSFVDRRAARALEGQARQLPARTLRRLAPARDNENQSNNENKSDVQRVRDHTSADIAEAKARAMHYQYAAAQLAEKQAATLHQLGDNDSAAAQVAASIRQRASSIVDEHEVYRALVGDALLRDVQAWRDTIGANLGQTGIVWCDIAEVGAHVLRQRFDLAVPLAERATEQARVTQDASLIDAAIAAEHGALHASGDLGRLRERMSQLLPTLSREQLITIVNELWLPDDPTISTFVREAVDKSVLDSRPRREARRAEDREQLLDDAQRALDEYITFGSDDANTWLAHLGKARELDCVAAFLKIESPSIDLDSTYSISGELQKLERRVRHSDLIIDIATEHRDCGDAAAMAALNCANDLAYLRYVHRVFVVEKNETRRQRPAMGQCHQRWHRPRRTKRCAPAH